ncbi:MAG: type I methionyl aminopeptidase [Candidatus Uhrbacteria bacterium]
MSLIKTDDEIKIMREGGKILSQALAAAVRAVRPGVGIRELDEIAEASLRAAGAVPSFKGFCGSKEDPPFPSTLCVSIGPEVVHGSADRNIKLKAGEIVSLDIGCEYKGLFTDMAVSVAVGEISPAAKKLMEVTREALFAGVRAVKSGGDVRDISSAVENYIKPHGYGIVMALVGHGVGHAVHESPNIPNFISRKARSFPLKPGMCLAIEPMIAMKSGEVVTADDGWTVITKDGSLAAHFEMTVVVTKKGHEILTLLP